jgi:hypothetical protein
MVTLMASLLLFILGGLVRSYLNRCAGKDAVELQAANGFFMARPLLILNVLGFRSWTGLDKPAFDLTLSTYSS